MNPRDTVAHAVCAALIDEDGGVRFTALDVVMALGLGEQPACAAAIVRAVSDPVASVRLLALRALRAVDLSGSAEATAHLAAAAHALDDEVRFAALTALAEGKGVLSREFGPPLAAAMSVPEPVLRAMAARALGRLCPELSSLAVAVLTRALDDPDWRVGPAATLALVQQVQGGATLPEKTAAALVRTQADWSLRQATHEAVETLLAGPLAQPRLALASAALAVLRSGARRGVAQAVRTLGMALRTNDAAVMGLVIDGLRSTDWRVRRALVEAAAAAGTAASESLVGAVEGCLDDREKRVRMVAAQTLSALGPQLRHAPELAADMTRTSDAQRRTVLAYALSGAVLDRPADVVGPLLADAQSRVAKTRCDALTALGRLPLADRSPEVLAALASSVRDPGASVRRAAIRALGSLGQRMPVQAVAALTEALVDQNYGNVAAALTGLGTLGTDIPAPTVRALLEKMRNPVWIGEHGPKRVLAQLSGGVAPAVEAVLREATTWPDEWARAVAAAALERVTGVLPPAAATTGGAPQGELPAGDAAESASQEAAALARARTLLAGLAAPDLDQAVTAAMDLRTFNPGPNTAVAHLFLDALPGAAWARPAIVSVLGRVGQDARDVVIPVLVALLEDAERDVRHAALWALHRIGDAGLWVAVLKGLVYLAGQEDDYLRYRALCVLGDLGQKLSPEGRTYLVEALRDPAPRKRRAALVGLGGLSYKSATIRAVETAAPYLEDEPEADGDEGHRDRG